MALNKSKVGALAGVVILSLLGLWFEKALTESKLEYSITIPADVSKDVTLYPKMAAPYAADGRELYARRHRNGWDECLDEFRAGRLTETSTPSIKQQFGLEASAESDGYEHCKNEIFRLIDAHGKLFVRIANR